MAEVMMIEEVMVVEVVDMVVVSYGDTTLFVSFRLPLKTLVAKMNVWIEQQLSVDIEFALHVCCKTS
jgi:hypothetical protein